MLQDVAVGDELACTISSMQLASDKSHTCSGSLPAR